MKTLIGKRRSDGGSGWNAGLTISAMGLAGILLVLSCRDGAVQPRLPPPAPAATTVTVSPASATLTALEEATRLTAEVRDQNEQVMAGAAVGWASDNIQVATVDESGLVTAVANGSATITATSGSTSASATVTVAQEVSTVRIVEGNDQMRAQGRTLPVPITVHLVDGNEHPVAGARVDFVVGDPRGAAVPASGVSDDSGRAQTNWTLGMVVGKQALKAIAGGASVDLTATAIAILTSLSVDPRSLAPSEAGQTGP